MYYEKSHFNTNPGDYKIHPYDKIHEYNHFHDYNHVHDYNTTHKYDKIRTYDKIREYKYQEYIPTKEEPRKKRHTYPQPVIQPIKRKRKSVNNWPDKPIYTHKYRPYEYIPPPQHREYVYKEYNSKSENYFAKKISPYNGSVDYKLTPENFYPFRYRKGKQKRHISEDENNNDDQVKRETSLRDIELKDDIDYKPEFRREPVLPTAFVFAPKPEVQRKPSPVYIPETRQEESLPTAFVIAPIVIKPKTPVYIPETRQEPVFPSKYVYAPSSTILAESQPSPQIRRVAASRQVKSEKSVSRSSPARTIHTPIGSRSSSPVLAPVGAAFVGGIIGATVVNKNRSPIPQREEKQQLPKEDVKDDKKSERSVSPDVATVAVVGGAAGIVHTESSKPKERVPSPERQSTPVIEQENKPMVPLPQTTRPQSTPKPEPDSVKTEPEVPKQPETRKEAPVAVAVVAPLTNAKKKPSPLPAKNNDYKEVPSSWSPIPFKGPSLPPEVIATIEAYDKAHVFG